MTDRRSPELLFTGLKDRRLVTPDWQPSDPVPIDGVAVKGITSVYAENGILTEIYRQDWQIDDLPVAQVFQKLLYPGNFSAWHMHRHTTDRLFCALGRVKIVLFDGRAESPTARAIAEYRVGAERPALLVVPPGVWHGVLCLGHDPALVINAVDAAYSYDDPDHWRLPADTPLIPYSI